MAFMMSDKNTVLLIMLVVEIVSLPFFWAWLYGGGFSAWYERHLTKRALDGAKRTAKKGSISGKRSGRSPRQ